ncbi:glycosyltransferase family 2 protein [Mycoplasma feriruminatoris]|uniref:Glycan synthase of Mollicutes Gsm2 n=1 Tax=Mycoplasma feriruminatoris TaxID=1179777 RepID=A0ABY8HUC7_9MOLU|nr:glycosyltransferase family 2 protein [Mycoplasma feriruminatoris]WFQ90697.1 Glycan synthase of Mollicutes Gsm2 [Mycoplasma feriruminatoris]WFQ91518.1 Glycan synthase of Mollicutes Gsm2 [Mycoplasma feriruminatoris]WFQ93213.1 Glycan synthase of Mollicutes Gsm2 [Mycoplasma feriruminatoris]WFQ94050.1 Glycan synthase of Mollicutes Gsm2 [Mycoplasma feriruminatoris]
MINYQLNTTTTVFFYITLVIGIIFMLLLSSDWLFFMFAFIKNKKKLDKYKPKKNRSFAIVIPAHNESGVVGQLIDSLKAQKYDGVIDIYLVADNCTDNRKTYNVGIEKNVIVLERFHETLKGGNFAIQHGWRYIRDNNLLDKYDCFCTFDADNLVDENWVYEVNKTFDFYNDIEVVTTYRNSKNYADNWITSAYSIQFFKESDVINKGRTALNHSSYVNGTGFCITRKIFEQTNWWDFNSLSHDIEFTQWLMLNKIKTGYAYKAYFYDEQPVDFKSSWKQRMRWCVGFKQVWNIYKSQMIKNMFKFKINKIKLWANFTMIFPAIITLVVNLLFWLVTSGLMVGNYVVNYLNNPTMLVEQVNNYLRDLIIYCTTTPLVIFGIIFINYLLWGFIVVIRNRKSINATKWQKFKSIFTYPLFMLTYIPISFLALFKKTYSTTPVARKAQSEQNQIPLNAKTSKN